MTTLRENPGTVKVSNKKGPLMPLHRRREEERGNKAEKVATSTRDGRPAATPTRNKRNYDKWDEPRPREREKISGDLKQVAASARG